MRGEQPLHARHARHARHVPRAGASIDAPPTVAELGALLRTLGARAVLGALNARTRFRYTGLYRVEPPLLRGVCLYDRENPGLCLGGDVDTLSETYCAVVVDTERPFATSDGRADPRLAGRPAAAGPYRSYVGVPIGLADGRVGGTLCHFDYRPRLLPPGELALLERAAELLGVTLAPPSPPGSPAR